VAAPQAAEGTERRQLTVLFCDLVGSTRLATRLDPEEMHSLIRIYHEVAGEQVARHGGLVAQYLGDGILAYFGYPVAREDAASRAVAAALGIVDALKREEQRVSSRYGEPLLARFGLHTGVVVIGPEGALGTDRLALGDVPNIAARLQALAEPETVLMTDVTAGLVAREYETKPRGPQILKGVSAPVAVYELIGRRSVLDEWIFGRYGELVNREGARATLDRAWEHVRGGQGRVVLLSGVAGIGKSRLVHHLRSALDPAAGETRMEFRGSDFHREGALHPFVEQLRHASRFAESDSPHARLVKLRETLSRRGLDLDERPALASLLSLPAPLGAEPVPPQELKERAHRAIETWVLAHASTGPLLVIFEDLHLVDPSSLEVLSRLMGSIRSRPVLLALTFRAGFEPPAPQGEPTDHVERIELERLPAAHVEQMIENLAHGRALPAQLVKQLVDRVDGVPVFVEELTRAVLTSGLLRESGRSYEFARATPGPRVAIPATLQDSLMAQLDRLGAVRGVAQTASVLGREFDHQTMLSCSGLSPDATESALTSLVDAGVLFRSGSPPSARYLFRHALLQEAAYASLLKKTRRDLHARAAEALRGRERELVDAGSPVDAELVRLLAHHWREAVDPTRPDPVVVEQAARYLVRAGEDALVVCGYREAEAHLRGALALLELLDEGRRRDELELSTRLHLNTVYQATIGWASDAARDGLDRCRELCLRLGDRPELLSVLFGYFQYNFFLAKYPRAEALALECHAEAQRIGNEDLLMQALAALSNSRFWLGETDASVHASAQVLERYDPARHAVHAVTYGTDPGVWAFMLAVWGPWSLGRPATAARNHDALERLSNQLQHPFSMALALNTSCCFHLNCRDVESTREAGRKLTELARQHGMPVYEIFGALFYGWAMGRMGRVDEVFDHVSATYSGYVKHVGGLAQTYAAMMAADVYRRAGRLEQAIEVLDAALALAEAPESRELAYHAELVRIKGEMLVQRSPAHADEGHSTLRRALELAVLRKQPPFALRAALDLLSLAERRGERLDEPAALVSEQIASFAETEPSVDIRRARETLARIEFGQGAHT
jgi:class 3 adenylate cyclase